MKRLAMVSLLGLVLAGAAFATDWPVFRGPDRNGISKETGWAVKSGEAPRQLWKASVGDGFSAVTVQGGKAVTMGHREDMDIVWCFDAEKGTVLWQYSYPAAAIGTVKPDYPGPRSTPTLDGGSVFTFSRDGQVFCLDAASGSVKWSQNVTKEPGYATPRWGFGASPLVMGDLVILNAGAAGIAFDKSSGKVAWSSEKGLGGYNTPVVYQQAGKPRLAFSNASEILSVEPDSGKVVWRFPWKTNYEVNSADLIYFDGKLFASSAYDFGCALLDVSTDTPKIEWQNKSMRNHFHTCVLLNGYLYGIDGAQQRPDGLKCLDVKTGEVKWAAPEVKFGGLILADGKLMIHMAKGELVVAQATPEKYTELARTQLMGGESWTAPVLANGRLYARNRQGDVVCVDLK